MASSASPSVRVEKATSDLLIGPDWTLNIEICDSINSDHWQAKDVVKAVKKRLQHKSPKVQFLALTLLETMMKNCGDYVHFQVVERDILQEMTKIVKKKMDMQVRDKILVLLDSWQEAFGGPGGKYPQYYWAYTELRRCGIQFPQRSADAVPIFTPPVMQPVPSHPPVGYGMPSHSSIRLEEAMASEMGNLSKEDLDSIQRVMELLSDMLQAVNVNDQAALKDDVIVDLVGQCRSNQKKLMHLVNSTGDEELLARGLALNDSLQSLLSKHDAIASGSPLPSETNSSFSSPKTPNMPIAGANKHSEDEDDEDDGFSQLARRNEKIRNLTSQGVSVNSGDTRNVSEKSVATFANTFTAASTTEESSSSASALALTLPDPPAPVKTSAAEQDMIDLMSITLSSNPSPPHTPSTPPSVIPSGSYVSASPTTPAVPYSSHPHLANQTVTPYVVPWAQQVPSDVQSQPQHTRHQSQAQYDLHPQFQTSQFLHSSRYPPPPWENQENSTVIYSTPNIPRAVSSDTNSMAVNVPQQSFRPSQQSHSFGARVTNLPPTAETHANNIAKPFVPSYRLFEDLVQFRNPGGAKNSSLPPNLSGSSSQNVVRRK